ncbi:hypothetical protein evm_001754 [Chilo suppressalis]|nr:hypothetical protein evm_001754 [Chilo suppressalis]
MNTYHNIWTTASQVRIIYICAGAGPPRGAERPRPCRRAPPSRSATGSRRCRTTASQVAEICSAQSRSKVKCQYGLVSKAWA